MNRYKINLITMSDVEDFISRARDFSKNDLYVEDNDGHRVSAQSLLGMLYSMEWSQAYLYSKSEDPKVCDAFRDYFGEEEF